MLIAVAALLLAGWSAASLAQNSVSALPTQLANEPALLLGVAWYPEQWPESRWEQDLKLMEEAHIHAVRVAEFAWSTMEPSEGRFEFGWLDRAVALAGRHHIVVILGTPTAAPPAWLTSKYPDTLRVEQDGQRVQHGGRAHGSALLQSIGNFAGELLTRWRGILATMPTWWAGRSITSMGMR